MNIIRIYSSYRYCVVHYTPGTHSSYNQKFVSFDHLAPSPPSPLCTSGNHKFHLFFNEFGFSISILPLVDT